jgi:hypothetical protein
MSYIKYLYLPQLHHGENATFHRESLKQLENAGIDRLGVTEQFNEYKISCDDLQATIDVFSGSKLSQQSYQSDKLRDRAYSALKAYVKVYLNDDDPIKVDAAERIISVIRQSSKEVGNPLKLGSTKESTALISLLDNLQPLDADIKLIGAENKLNNLKETNQAFIDLQFERHIEKSEKHSGDVKSARVVTDSSYNRIIERIEAKILLEGIAQFESYVKAQNVVVEKYKNLVAQRKGRADKTEDKK